jgi:hypothetical protein
MGGGREPEEADDEETKKAEKRDGNLQRLWKVC